jgi:uncharacterized repeat protein (TIGR01451 family)/LPXTG-motif cell wall-anchored protein
MLAGRARRATFAILAVALATGQFFVPALVSPASAAGLSTNFFDYSNHDVATTTAGLVDWANNGALTSSTTLGATWTRAGDQGIFDGGKYNGTSVPPTGPLMTANANALKAAGTIGDAKFVVDPIASDKSYTCQSPSGPVTVSGDTTTFAGAGSETNNGQIGTFTYGASGQTPAKDDLSNVYAVSHIGGGANEVFFGGERLVNNGDSHIDFEFLQSNVAIPNACASGTFTGHRTQRDMLLATDFSNGGTLGNVQLYSWSCNGIAPGAVGYDATKDGTVCDPPANGNPGKGDPQYVAIPSQNNGVTVASFGVNSGSTAISCGGWVCRTGNGSSSTTLATNALMEGGIDLGSAGFKGCFNTFLPHTRSSGSFTAVLKDFAGPIQFSNCKTPTISTQQSSGTVTPGSSITVGIGSSVTDTATLNGAAANVGGTVSYKLYSDQACTQLVADGGTKTVSGTSNNGTITLPSSDAVPVNTAGTYYWQAVYSGDISSGGVNEGVTSNCGDEVLTVVAPALTIKKTADASPVNAGDNIGYSITVTNTGAGVANNVTLSDPLPTGSGITWSVTPPVPGCSITTGTLSCNFGTLAANGGSASVHISSPTVFASCNTYTNTATASASNAASVHDTASITVNCPSLTIKKTADAALVNAGTNIGFTITVNNAGPGTAKSVNVTDPLPTGVAGSGISWSVSPPNAACNIASGTLSCNFGDIASGASASVHITSPTVFASCATYTNTATATSGNFATIHDTASTTVQCPQLTVKKSADQGSVNAGDSIGFTILVSNSGPGVATGATLTDPLPGGSGVSWSVFPAYTGPGTCTVNGSAPTQTLSCSFGDLAAGASASVHVTSQTANASCASYPNTATAQATNFAAVQDHASITVNCPNLSITKAADAVSVSAGTNIGFLITVNNAGPGTAKAVTVHDPLPTAAGINWIVSPPNAACSITNATLNCNFGDMAAGASASVHITSATSGATVCQVYTNTAFASGSNAPQVQDTASETVLCPGVQVVKKADNGTVNAGDPIGFTVTVSNKGAGTATGVTLTDPLPAGNGVSWSINPPYTGLGSCGVSGTAPTQTLSCTFGDMAPSASASVHITSATVFASCAMYTNTATASATNDPNTHQDTASTTVQCPNLSISKIADNDSVSKGSSIGFLISVHNAGPGVAKSVTLNDPLPTGAGISWSMSPTNPLCSITNNTLNCNFGDMASGASASVHITSGTTVDTPCAVYTNTATVNAANDGPFSDTAMTTVECPGLHISKSADNATVSAGDNIGFKMTVSNTGVGTATGVTLSDPLPTGPVGSGISWSVSPTNPLCSITNGTLNCNFGDLASGASASVHITSATTFASCGDYPNIATASSTNSPSVSDNATTTVECPDLKLTKSADSDTVSAGDNIGFTVTLMNNGQGVAKSVTLTDPLPTGPAGSGISWSMSPANPLCSITNNTLNCNFGDLASGASTSVHVVSATTAQSCAAYPNTATADASNNPEVKAHASTTVECPALAIMKTADASPVNTGDQIGFTITVSNSNVLGTGTAKAVTLNDPLPKGNGVDWTIDTAPATCQITGPVGSQVLSCSLGDMPPGASASVHIVSATTVDSAGSYPNTATASASNTDSVHDSATIVVLAPSLSIHKTADASPVNTGDQIGFTITVSNSNAAGTGTAKSVTMTDPLPKGNGVDWMIDTAPGTCQINGAVGSQVLSCSLGDMGPGASASIHIVSATTADSAGSYPNTATASASNAGSVQDSATIVVLPPSLSIHKTADAATVSAGADIGFSITVANGGPGVAQSVTIDDAMPTGAPASGISWSISPKYSGQGTCDVTANVLHCDLGDLASGAQVLVHVSSPTNAASCATYTNTASTSASNAPTTQDTASTTVECPLLQITKIADDPSVSAGDSIGFAISVHNAGLGVASGVTVDDPLPGSGVLNWTISPPNGDCSIANNTLHCDFGTLESGATVSVHIMSSTTAAACRTWTNTATASADNADGVQDTASTTVECPLLSINKTADATPVNTGDQIGFKITVSNADNEGVGVAHNVMVNDPLPKGDGVDWTIDTAPQGCNITGPVGTQVLSCSLGDLTPGESVSVHIVSVTTAASAGTYPNTATVSADNAPSSQSSATVVVQAPKLAITKVADASPVNAGSAIGFTITVSNSNDPGTGIARSVTLTDPLPGGTDVDWSISPAYTAPGSCAITGTAPTQTLGCQFGDMAPGASASVHITSATTDASVATYKNTATASTTNGGSVHASATVDLLAVTPVTVLESTTTTTTTTPVVQTLPRTGSNSWPLIFIGLAFVAGGVALAASRRRRLFAAKR